MSFDRNRVTQLINAIDASPSQRESTQAFNALQAYLEKHGKKFSNVFQGSVLETVLDMKQQDSITKLERERAGLKDQLIATQEKLEKTDLRARSLSSELSGIKAKKFIVTGLVGIFTGAACATGYFLGNAAWSYTGIKNGLESHYAQEESKMKRNWLESKTFYDTRSKRLEQDSAILESSLRAKYQSLSDKTRQETLLDLERTKTSLRKEYERGLMSAREDFKEKIAAGQPYKSGTGRYGYIHGRNEYVNIFEKEYGSDVVAKLAVGSCVLIKGSSQRSHRLIVEQYIQGRYISGTVDVSDIQVGNVGPTADCVTKNALLTPN